MAPVVDELARMIAFPTVSNRPVTALAAHLAERAEARGFRIERFVPPGQDGKCTVVASAGPGDARPGLAISGHMDVVPTEGQPWTSDPFRLTERDGVLYGRGTADMKGFIAAVVTALERIPVAELRRPLQLVWTHDEEIGCLGSAGLAAAWADRAVPQACWIGEPTAFQILRMHPGHVAMEVEVRGRAAHSSRPDLGLNAIEGAAAVVGAVRALAVELENERRDIPEMDRPWVAVNVGQIDGGTAVNVVPDRCVIRIGYRPLPGDAPAAVHDRLAEKIRRLELPQPVHTRILRETPSLLTREDTPLRTVLADHADHAACGCASFATDGGNLARLGMAPLVFGPGSIEVAHQADEHVAVRDLVRTVDIAESVIRRWCC